jgi:acetyltransferase
VKRKTPRHYVSRFTTLLQKGSSRRPRRRLGKQIRAEDGARSSFFSGVVLREKGFEQMTDSALSAFFHPNGVALIGASRDPAKLGYAVLRNLVQHGYTGPVYPVNPKADEILGARCYSSVLEVPDPVELAVIIAPAPATPDIIEQIGQRGIRAAIIISGGFSEIGPQGVALENQVVEIARRYGVRLIGPNCVGVIDTHTGLDTTFVPDMPKPGVITFVSQSGAVCGGVIDWASGAGIGLSRIVTLGNQADLTETDILQVLADDDNTRVVAMYLEGVDDGRRFVDVARSISTHKPIVAIKVGYTEAGRKAAASHTGALAGTDSAYRAAFHHAGIIRVPHLEALFDAAISLANQPLPRGERVAILTNAGGPGAMASDALEAHGLRLASLTEETQFCLRQFLQPHANVSGPVDMLGGADEHDYARALDALLKDPAVDAVLVINVPQALVPAIRIVREIADVVHRFQVTPGCGLLAGAGKPVMTCLIGDVSLPEAIEFMRQAELPLFPFPERAAAALGAMVERRRWLENPFQISSFKFQVSNFQSATLAPHASAGVSNLQSRIPTLPMKLAQWANEAARIAQEIGFPVAVKIASPDISHKSDVGGVEVGLRTASAVRAAFKRVTENAKRAKPDARIEGVTVQAMARPGREVIVGAVRDPQFGPLVMFGSGGVYVELLKDVSFRLAPVSRSEAEAMIEETLAGKLLSGLRGQPPADKSAVAEVIMAVSELVAADERITEMDINPLMVYNEGQGAVAVDVRVATKPSQ